MISARRMPQRQRAISVAHIRSIVNNFFSAQFARHSPPFLFEMTTLWPKKGAIVTSASDAWDVTREEICMNKNSLVIKIYVSKYNCLIKSAATLWKPLLYAQGSHSCVWRQPRCLRAGGPAIFCGSRNRRHSCLSRTDAPKTGPVMA